jgi:predicted ribosome quality control (RQC) complex YloA/Tae2 family protein
LGRKLRITLEPAFSPQENLGRLYKRAAKGERGLKIIESRLEEVRRRVVQDEEILQEHLPALSHCYCRDDREIEAMREALLELGEQNALIKPPAAGAPRAGEGTPLFRRYLLPGGWQVLVGRNNRENDLLTHREAALQDLWFHAAGVSGSHVILKTGGHRSGPPKSILEAAAGIAAFHSRARHSSTVPVIYTEKRYVRKPRKGAPGLALCTREKTLFVKPEPAGDPQRGD